MHNHKRYPRRRVRPRVPLAYAGLLVIALVAVVGFAAFSPSASSGDGVATAESTVATGAPGEQMSARVASAVLALHVSDPSTRTATTQVTETASIDTQASAGDTTDSSDETDAAQDATVTLDVETTTTTAAAALEGAAPDSTPPSLTVTSPHDGDTVDSTIVTFTGTVERGATVRSGPYEATVNDDGTWSIMLGVVPGANGASFTATDAAGNTSSTRIVVNYSLPQTATTKAPTTTTTAPHDETPTTTAPHDETPTTTAPHDEDETTTTKATSTSPKWSPNWPADAGGIRSVEVWRSLVAKYWAADRVDCVLGIIQRESKGDPRAYNATFGASGLMQHLIGYWAGRAASAGFKDSNGLVASPYNGEANIAAGAAIAGSGSNWYAPWSRLTPYGSCSG